MANLAPEHPPHPCPRCHLHGIKPPVHFCEVKDCNCKDCKKIGLNWQKQTPDDWSSGKLWCGRCRIHGIETFLQHTCKYLECNCDDCQKITIAKEAFALENEHHRGRIRKCPKCCNHGIRVRLEGHKDDCEFENCTCNRCDLIVARERVMALQAALRQAARTPAERAQSRKERRRRTRPMRKFKFEMRRRLIEKFSGHLYMAIPKQPIAEPEVTHAVV